MTRAPLRFLLAMLVLWVGVRAMILLPAGPDAPIPAAKAAAQPSARPVPPTPETMVMAGALPPGIAGPSARPKPPGQADRLPGLILTNPGLSTPSPLPARAIAPRAAGPPAPAASAGPPALPSRLTPSRWSVSAWLLVRDEGGAGGLAPGGTLGGSQAGARVTYALGAGLSLSARAYLPLRYRAGSELAVGVDWHPFPSVPIHLLAERRQRLGRAGRNAFALTLYGGGRRNLTPRLQLDAYGQTGIVGRRSRDLFIDGSVRLSRRIGAIELGVGAWGAAQPGVRRLDAGPTLSWRLPVRDANLRLQADWRFRVAGTAAPGSGPALTLAADF